MIIAAVSSNDVALAAVGMSALVGFGGPVLQARFASRRQEKALEAARNELDDRLTAEAARLDKRLAAEHRRVLFDAERQVLDASAAFLQQLRMFFNKSPGPTQAELDGVTQPLGEQLARLRLWFDEKSVIVESFGYFVTFCGMLAFERHNRTEQEVEGLEEQIQQHRDRFLDAAKAHLAER
jgi:hypothetical protein